MANYTIAQAAEPMDYTLYRAWADDVLLYVGITASRSTKTNRFKFHSRHSYWWRYKTHITKESIGLMNRDAARRIESRVIRDERPLCNAMGNVCIIPRCTAPAVADLMCTDHYANLCMPWPFSLENLLGVRSGAIEPEPRLTPRPHLVARHQMRGD